MTADVGIRDPDTQCVMKRTYANKQGAKRAARAAMSNGGVPLDSYRCPHCGSWHNGRRPYGF